MKNLESPGQIWKTRITTGDFKSAVDYATISLPWTFDRMHYGPKKQNTVNNRLWHIMSGVLNQTLLERELKSRGYHCKLDWSHYRITDIFDFEIGKKVFDVKTASIFSEYDEQLGREPFSPELLIRYRKYPGPKWRRFIPMMVPMTQLNVAHEKNGYIFGLAVLPYDQRKLTPTKGDKGFWCAAPYGDAHSFLHKRALIEAREQASKGFFPVFEWKKGQATLDDTDSSATITIYGEWDGDKAIEKLELSPGQRVVVETELSSLSCIRLEHPTALPSGDVLKVRAKNNLKEAIPDFTDPTKNLNDSRFVWDLGAESFVNLRVPEDYVVYWLGHIPLQDFAQRFQNYPCWFIPNPKNMDENVPGELSNDFREGLEAYDRRRAKAIANGLETPWPEMMPLVRGKTINAGIMIAATRPGQNLGAACYVYPPYALSESALYVLPKDLYPMASI